MLTKEKGQNGGNIKKLVSVSAIMSVGLLASYWTFPSPSFLIYKMGTIYPTSSSSGWNEIRQVHTAQWLVCGNVWAGYYVQVLFLLLRVMGEPPVSQPAFIEHLLGTQHPGR